MLSTVQEQKDIISQLKNGIVYKTLGVLYEHTKREFKYPEELIKSSPDIRLEVFITLLEQLREVGYVSCDSVYRNEKPGDRRFYAITISGKLKYEELGNLIEDLESTRKEVTNIENKINLELNNLQKKLSRH